MSKSAGVFLIVYYRLRKLIRLIVWHVRTSLVAQTVKCLSTMRETWVQSLGQEDLLEKEMATHSNLLA